MAGYDSERPKALAPAWMKDYILFCRILSQLWWVDLFGDETFSLSLEKHTHPCSDRSPFPEIGTFVYILRWAEGCWIVRKRFFFCLVVWLTWLAWSWSYLDLVCFLMALEIFSIWDWKKPAYDLMKALPNYSPPSHLNFSSIFHLILTLLLSVTSDLHTRSGNIEVLLFKYKIRCYSDCFTEILQKKIRLATIKG